jgi:hypothetical protein
MSSQSQPNEGSSGDGDLDDIVALVSRAVAARHSDPDEEAADELDDVGRALVALLETVDPSTLAGAIRVDRLPRAVDWLALPEALSTGDYRSVIAYETLPELIDPSPVLESTDVREGWRRTDELGDEVREAVEALAESADESADTDTDTNADADTDDASEGTVAAVLDDLTEGIDDTAPDESSEESDAGDATVGLATSLSGTDEGRNLLVQKEVRDAADELREGILHARRRVEDAVEGLDARTEGVGQPTSRNPTAYSTLPRSGPPPDPTMHSTVPTQVRYSNAPGFERVYGRRFDDDDRDDDDETD